MAPGPVAARRQRYGIEGKNMKSKIRMVGFDLDGTILDSHKQLSKVNKEAVARTIEKGILVLPATGRPQAGVPREILEIPGVRYLLASNGTRIVDLTTGEVIYQVRMSHGQTMRVARGLARVSDGMWELYADGKCFVDRGTYRFVDHPAMTDSMIRYLSSTRTYVEDLLSYMEEKQIEAEKFQVFFEKEERRQRQMEVLEQEGGLNITNSSVYNLEIISDRAGKGNGLLALGKLLGISREEIMGIGDSSNDWDMLRKVGFPVVMENADEETKKLGKYITGTNDENGVAQVLQHFFPEEETERRDSER